MFHKPFHRKKGLISTSMLLNLLRITSRDRDLEKRSCGVFDTAMLGIARNCVVIT